MTISNADRNIKNAKIALERAEARGADPATIERLKKNLSKAERKKELLKEAGR